MNPHRKGNAFPQAGVPGDPRLLDQLHRQMVRGPNMQITHTHSGTLINLQKNKTVTIPPIPTHPWKCIANGGNTITVLSGNMWTYRNNGTGYAGDPLNYTAFPLEFDGVDDLTITATGYVYALCDIAQILVLNDTGASGIPFWSERDGFSGTPEVIFSTDAPSVYSPQNNTPTARNFAIPLASVGWDSVENIASVLKQYIVDDIWPVGGSATYEPTP